MNFKNLLKFEVIIGLVIILFTIICYFKFRYTETESENVSNKILHYYGGHHCPHSNKTSSMYNLIHNKFNKKYSQIKIIDYWGTEDKDRESFIKNNIQYVPTLMNNEGKIIKIGIPESVDVNSKNEDELEEILLTSLYNQL